ncbi:PLDc N-terminal domain-containing protein [Citrobacter amalonaticus]|uniref:PLDc N-terminal domain-containing protein n=2 Tax=Enterobacteriaceae TaxID=543 RepID=UPI0004D7E151|nr:PLDc N-terminal domain-containing protein [Citrobacter amalonaticus]KEY50974.1 membrane protein [Citrobacter amalonaticus]MBC6532494.1 hypothetical protein [Citrobacter amalonaticus]MBJ9326917.1 PLDc N-terminal domain-containing protein [Citrobacter amalonaticus]RSC56844.1 hypothetical protein EGW07_03970 [Citrobacter amalonaticus]HAU4370928.1 hypothetical protein [Citrobacter amalonaticus]
MLNHLMSFWSIAVTTFSIFFFMAYLMVIFQIVTDLFRDDKLHGFFKAVWIVLLLFVPLMTALMYLIFRGKGMAARQCANNRDIFWTGKYNTSKTPAEQILDARALLQDNIITEDEFKTLKNKALS